MAQIRFPLETKRLGDRCGGDGGGGGSAGGDGGGEGAGMNSTAMPDNEVSPKVPRLLHSEGHTTVSLLPRRMVQIGG